MVTVEKLREIVMGKAGVTDMFAFRCLSRRHNAFWDEMNEVEFQRGYVPEEYEKPDTPALFEMELLTEEEFAQWVEKFEVIHAEWFGKK